MITPHPLDRDKRAGLQGAGGGLQGIFSLGQGITVACTPAKLWAALGAAYRLGVVTPVLRILVGASAVRAHGETRHGGVGPVVGEAADDAVAGAAVSAVGEGVTVVAICGVGDVPGAGLAHALIRRDGDRGRALLLAGPDMKGAVKVGVVVEGEFLLTEVVNATERWRQFP